MVGFATTMSGKIREALNGPGDLIVRDISKSGEWLVARDVSTLRIFARTSGDSVLAP